MSMSQSEALGGLASLARRDVVKGGVGAVALGMASLGLSEAAAAASPCPDRGELFAFRAPDTPALVLAVSFPVTRGTAPDALPPVVRFHAGSKTWMVAWNRRSPLIASGEGGALIFTGQAVKPAPPGQEIHHLVVVSTPLANLPDGELQIWAEVLGPDGSRLRIGNPIVAELLAQDPVLAGVFNKAHPNRDRALFAEALARRIKARGAPTGPVDPEVHGQRLATMLLPDNLPFNPRLPVGFTFAAQNGRRPSDAVADIINTVLAGIASPGARSGTPFRETNAFPYFHSAVV